MAGKGRPKAETEATSLRLHVDMIRELDDIRRQEPDLPSRPEIIRRILRKYLDELRDNKD